MKCPDCEGCGIRYDSDSPNPEDCNTCEGTGEVPDCDHSKITRDDTYPDNGSFYRCKKCHQAVEKEMMEKPEVPDQSGIKGAPMYDDTPRKELVDIVTKPSDHIAQADEKVPDWNPREVKIIQLDQCPDYVEYESYYRLLTAYEDRGKEIERLRDNMNREYHSCKVAEEANARFQKEIEELKLLKDYQFYADTKHTLEVDAAMKEIERLDKRADEYMAYLDIARAENQTLQAKAKCWDEVKDPGDFGGYINLDRDMVKELEKKHGVK